MNMGSFCWLAMRSRLSTIGKPAPTRAASLLAKTAFSLTPGAFSKALLRSKDSKLEIDVGLLLMQCHSLVILQWLGIVSTKVWSSTASGKA